jgi:hypothetical protein
MKGNLKRKKKEMEWNRGILSQEGLFTLNTY